MNADLSDSWYNENDLICYKFSLMQTIISPRAENFTISFVEYLF